MLTHHREASRLVQLTKAGCPTPGEARAGRSGVRITVTVKNKDVLLPKNLCEESSNLMEEA
jgi:hypothetical protein